MRDSFVANVAGWRKRQIALDQKAENAKELGLDYAPVAIVTSESGANVTHSWWHEPALPIGTKLYTAPQREWVGLTDEEMMDAIYCDDTPMERGRRVEAKLKEKNT